jgi:hypothetical protein
MSYAVLDYHNSRISVPQVRVPPSTGTPLFKYLYRRQIDSLESSMKNWLELSGDSSGVRDREFFDRGLRSTHGGQLEQLRTNIDAGRLCPLGLFADHGSNGTAEHHQVVAVGYDFDSYHSTVGDQADHLRIMISDPNHPGQIRTLAADLNRHLYFDIDDTTRDWRTYFVDSGYRPATPPVIAHLVPSSSDLPPPAMS